MNRLSSCFAPVACGALVAFGCFVLPAPARAAEDAWDGGYDLRAERRSGFVFSLGLGLGLGAGSGYPNEADKIDEAEFESTVDPNLGFNNAIWIGGALRDWFTFGLGLSGFAAKQGDLELAGGAYIVHIEAFPLWSLGGPFRDLAFFTNLGPGTATIKGGEEDADGGLVSYVGLGTSYELLRLGHFALGPTLEGVYLYSQSAEAGGAFLGLRLGFYGGPSGLPRL